MSETKILKKKQNYITTLQTDIAKFTYSPLGEAFEKQIKRIEDQGREQVDALINQNERQASLIKMIKIDLIKKYLKNLLEKDLELTIKVFLMT